MSWPELKKILQSMPETGKKGFEGLVATLLSELLNERFLVAGAGKQPSGDARNFSGEVSMQAKRYSDTTRLNANEIEGDIREVLRTLPKLNAYVLVATRLMAQIKDRLDQIEDETGVDIITLDLKEQISDLGALCIFFAESIREFPSLSSYINKFESWIMENAKTEHIIKRIEEVKNRIQGQVQTWNKIQTLSKEFLNKRFGYSKSQHRFLNSIKLSDRIPRPSIDNMVLNWWQNNMNSIAYLEGEEGNGKSWVAAACAKRICDDYNAIVFWLDSDQWCNAKSIEDILEIGFQILEWAEEVKIKKLMRKALLRWEHPLLIVLDGVNERESIYAAKSFLAEYFTHKEIFSHRIRILLTTRPLEKSSGYEANMWDGCIRFSVSWFNDDELNRAIRRFDPDLSLNDISLSLKSVARIPRYFHTCMKLKERFHSFGNVTKEVVLWEDLKSKIENTDHQIRENLGWKDIQDAEEILAELARGADFKDCYTGEAKLSLEFLNKCFDSKYSEIRQDLVEQRIASKAGPLNALLNDHHLVLGWALYLNCLLSDIPQEDLRTIIDIIRCKLEPIPSEDRRTEALFVALQLSALKDRIRDKRILNKRTALLYTWFRSQNASITEERLKFWARDDIPAYATFIESVFEDLYETAEVQVALIEPIALLWKNSIEDLPDLEEYIKKWLLLTWSYDRPTNEKEMDYGSHTLPAAPNRYSLRLSKAALSILSMRPVNRFLETLALCRSTIGISKGKGRTSEFPAKAIEGNIGTLMRWGYTEKIIPELLTIADNNINDELLLKGIRLLTQSLSLVSLPEILQLPPTKKPSFEIIPSVEFIRKNKVLFFEDGSSLKSGVGDLKNLAIRMDLPELLPGHKEEIIGYIEDLVETVELYKSRGRRIEDARFEEFWPWVAKFFPNKLNELTGRLILKALSYEHPYILLLFLGGTQFLYSAGQKDAIIKAIIELKDRLLDSEKPSAIKDFVLSLLTELMLFNASEETLKEWLNSIEGSKKFMDSLHLYPIPELLYFLLPKSLIAYAKNKTKMLSKEINKSSEEEMVSRFNFWCHIWACSTKEDPEDFEWAKNQLAKDEINHKVEFCLFALLAASGSVNLWHDIIDNPKIRRYLNDENFRTLFLFSKHDPKKIELIDSYKTIISELPRDYAGYFLSLSGRSEYFYRWGRELMEVACNLVEKTPFVPSHRGRIYFTLNQKGEIISISDDFSQEGKLVHYASPDSWGMDLVYPDKLPVSLESVELSDSEEHGQLIQDIEELSQWKGYNIFKFDSIEALRSWAFNYQKEFHELSEKFLYGLQGAYDKEYHLGSFTDAILRIFLSYEPKRAYEIHMSRQIKHNHINVITYYNTSAFVADLWNSKYCNQPEHKSLRRRLLTECPNDEEIIYVSLAALAEGGEEELWTLVTQDFLKDNLALMRNLGISILPWFSNEENIKLLEEIKKNDPSEWVRIHAKWAYEVAQQEYSCRKVYCKALNEKDPIRVFAYLHQMKPALLPSARWWRYKIETEMEFQSKCINKKIKALVTRFWYYWGNNSKTKSDIEAFGRKLTKFCRGELLNREIHPRMAPWWKI